MTITALRVLQDQRRAIVKESDLSEALRATANLEKTYGDMRTAYMEMRTQIEHYNANIKDMSDALSKWARNVPLERELARASNTLLADFAKKTSEAFVDSTRRLCEATEVKPGVVTSDKDYAKMLVWAAEADPLAQVRITHLAHIQAIDEEKRLTDRINGVKLKLQTGSGATEAEVATATKMTLRLERLQEIVAGRRAHLAELNLEAVARVEKFLRQNGVADGGTELTASEKRELDTIRK